MNHYNKRLIRVDNETTYLLGSWHTVLGMAIMISGPKTILVNEHTVTETDGSELKISEKTAKLYEVN